jgi:UDP:flavonoid glycosyltransferase YjiC (YdhE family)
VSEFLDSGPPPIVFTLGSSGVWVAANFYRAAAEAAAALGRRAVLLTGTPPENRPASLPDGAIAVDYATHSELFPRAAAIVHHGGAGTTGQALRSGRPMVIVPFSHDQPDNGARCERLGIARVVPRRAASARRLEAALRSVLEDPTVAARAAELGARTRAERGAAAAADAIERVLPAR